MGSSNVSRGRKGEEQALEFLAKNGYKVIARNYRSRFGEIDIIAYDHDVVCFVEVKSRSSNQFGSPQEAIIPVKQERIYRSALQFVKQRGWLDKKARFDVVAVTYGLDTPECQLIKNAFTRGE